MGTNGPFTVDALLSRECHQRHVARECVDLVFSSSTPEGVDAAISFLAFESYDVPDESSPISCSRRLAQTVSN